MLKGSEHKSYHLPAIRIQKLEVKFKIPYVDDFKMEIFITMLQLLYISEMKKQLKILV